MYIKNTDTQICNKKMTFEECEMALLRHSVEESELLQGDKIINNQDTQKILKILEEYIIDKKLICYGGTAINNILPKKAQFYDYKKNIPDYDFYSPNAFDDAKELSDIYFKKGYSNVVAKSGMHYGTYKVYVNFIPIADITFLHANLFDTIKKQAIKKAGIYYAPANFLRMNMFIELSRPFGDVSRWEKILTRLNLLNKYYPFNKNINCHTVDFQRKRKLENDISYKVFNIIKESFIDMGVVFFGGYASTLYSEFMSPERRSKIKNVPDFDVLHEEPMKCAKILLEALNDNNINNVSIIEHEEISEIIPYHCEIKVNNQSIAYIYQPIACHNYNTIFINENEIKVASIDTILSFYLAFYYIDKPYYDKDRILCMAQFLFDIEQQHRIENKGILKRFSTKCIGKQKTLDDIRLEKFNNYEELKHKRDTPEYQMWFLNYVPKPILNDIDKTLNHATKDIETKNKKTDKDKNIETIDVLSKDILPISSEQIYDKYDKSNSSKKSTKNNKIVFKNVTKKHKKTKKSKPLIEWNKNLFT